MKNHFWDPSWVDLKLNFPRPLLSCSNNFWQTTVQQSVFEKPCLRKGEGAAGRAAEAEVEESLHDGRDGDVAVGAHVSEQQVAELLAERVGHLRAGWGLLAVLICTMTRTRSSYERGCVVTTFILLGKLNPETTLHVNEKTFPWSEYFIIVRSDFWGRMSIQFRNGKCKNKSLYLCTIINPVSASYTSGFIRFCR